jgi:tetratricopeptide (TPR) repeat protein
MSYDKEYLATLAGKAGGGSLSAAELSHLKACQPNDPNYVRAYFLLAAYYEKKGDRKGHCETTKTVLAQSRHKYNPEWNLEGAKCSLRNGDWDGAAKLADNALSSQQDMSANTRSKRVLLAYRIKAKAFTTKYEKNAKENSGFGDAQLLNRAISAWMEVRNYASGVGNNKVLEAAKREVEDLEARRGP